MVASTTRIALLLKRVSWLAGLAILCVLGYALLEVVPAWHRYFQGASAHQLRRHAAIAFLDAFLITYLILPCMARRAFVPDSRAGLADVASTVAKASLAQRLSFRLCSDS